MSDKDVLEVQQAAARDGKPMPLAALAIDERWIALPKFWKQPVQIREDATQYAEVDILSHGGWLGEYARSVANSIQFPANTAFAHLLGVFSAATAKSFRYLYFGDSEMAVNLYVVTAQPSSSGKSGVHKKFITPCQIELEKLNRENAVNQGKINKQIEDVEKQIDELDKQGASNPSLLQELAELCEQRDKLNRIEFSFDDVTPEAAEAAAVRQNGLINITSAEADALNIILGDVYKGSGAKSNYGMFLKTWDTEWHSPSRITRVTKAGYVYGSVAVIAQQSAVESILQAGMTGRGISERMLLLSERPLMGRRDFSSHKPVDKKLSHKYDVLCHNVIFERESQVLKLNDDSLQLIADYRQSIEPMLADDGEYANAMIRGAMGKCDKQIIKIASLLHIADEWSGDSPRRKLFIQPDYVERAIKIFNELSTTYIQAADRLGFAGEDTELNCLIEALERAASKRKMRMTFRQFRDSVKNLKAMKNVPNVTDKLREKLLPKLERLNYCALDGDTLYVSPHLK